MGLHCQTAFASNQIVPHCCVKFQMTSKDVSPPLALSASICLMAEVILIEA